MEIACCLARNRIAGDANYVCENFMVSQASADRIDAATPESYKSLLGIASTEDGCPDARWFLPWRGGGGGLQAVAHAASGLFLASWSRQMKTAADKLQFPSSAELLTHVCDLHQLFDDARATSESIGGPSYDSANSLLDGASKAHAATLIRWKVVARTQNSLSRGANPLDSILVDAWTGVGTASWQQAPTEATQRTTDQQMTTTGVRLRMGYDVCTATILVSVVTLWILKVSTR